MLRFRQFRSLLFAGSLLAGAGSLVTVQAQDEDDLRRGVARISLIDGDVSVRRGDSGEWVAAVVNAPLLTDDRISTAPNSRAEVQFDSANILRIGANAEVRLIQLEYGRYQLALAHGTVTYVVLRASNANVELDTPNISVRPSRIGIYRVAVNDAMETEVTVRSGDVEVFTPRGSQWVNSGQSMIVRGTTADPEFQVVSAAPPDDWDRWNDARDRRLTQAVSYRYVPEGVYGVEELDPYGRWDYVESYGYCWRPTVVVAGWAPYRYGRWVWLDWYGWSWVGYDPWGWAPYHYGRWFHHGGYWRWHPGAFGYRHHWSPALVAFFGYGRGSRVGFGFGFGNVGWVPLGPGEAYHRWWGRNYYGRNTYIDRSINITNVNITNVYRNARVRDGISGIGEGDFRGGRFGNVRRVSGDQVREAGLIRGQVPVAPENAHLRFSDRNVANVPRSRDNVRFFSRQQPNPAERVSFADQRRSFEAAGRGNSSGGAPQTRNGADGRLSNSNAGQPGVDRSPGRVGVDSGARMNDRPQAATSPGAGDQAQRQSGWRRFGEPSRPAGSQAAAPSRTNNSNNEGVRSSPARNGGASNDRPPAAQSPDSRGAWRRFEGGTSRTASPEAGQTAAPRGAQDQRSQPPAGRNNWQRFGEPGSSPRQPANSAPRFDRSDPQSLRVSPPVVRERQNSPQSSAPSYNAPRSNPSPRSNSAPSYSAPRSDPSPRSNSAPSYSAPRSSPSPSYSAPRSNPSPRSNSAPSYSAPRSSPSPRYSAPRSSGGGGGGGSFSSPRSSGGGSSPRQGGGTPRGGGGRGR